MTGIVHGKASSYRNHGCRCTPCRDAATAACRRWKATKTSEPAFHNAATYVNHGCRCDDCREAHRVYGAELRAKARAAS